MTLEPVTGTNGPCNYCKVTKGFQRAVTNSAHCFTIISSLSHHVDLLQMALNVFVSLAKKQTHV
ncbi:unnamed protein product, partial [Vitis vinifera]